MRREQRGVNGEHRPPRLAEALPGREACKVGHCQKGSEGSGDADGARAAVAARAAGATRAAAAARAAAALKAGRGSARIDIVLRTLDPFLIFQRETLISCVRVPRY